MCCGQKRLELERNPERKTISGAGQFITAAARVQAPRIHTPAPAIGPQGQTNQVQATTIRQQVSVPANGALSIPIRYVETSRIRVRGPLTGLEYDFSGSHPVQIIDVRDAEALLKTRFFRKT